MNVLRTRHVRCPQMPHSPRRRSVSLGSRAAMIRLSVSLENFIGAKSSHTQHLCLLYRPYLTFNLSSTSASIGTLANLAYASTSIMVGSRCPLSYWLICDARKGVSL